MSLTITTYKAVLRKDGKLTSIDPPCESLRVVYPVQDWARAKVGGLLCFDNIFNAYITYSELQWYLFENIEIWEALGSEPIKIPKRKFEILSVEHDQITELDVIRLWYGTFDSDDSMYRLTSGWPTGSIGFRAVKLRYPVITKECRNDTRKLDGETYAVAHKAMRGVLSNLLCHELVYLTLGFETRESFRLAYEGRGPITVGQAYRIVSYGIEVLRRGIVEPLFYALRRFGLKGE